MTFKEYRPPEGWYRYNKKKKRIEGVLYAFFFTFAYTIISTLIYYI